MPARGGRRARRHHRAAADHPRTRSPGHLRDPVRLDRRRRRSVRARRRLQPLPVRARRRPRPAVHRRGAGARPRHLPRRHRPLRHDGRGDRQPLRARRHGGPRQVAAGAPGGGAHARHRAARADTVRPVPLVDVRALDVVRPRTRPRPSRLDAALVERRDARRQLRLVRRQPRSGHCRRRPARVTGAPRRRACSACSRAWREQASLRASEPRSAVFGSLVHHRPSGPVAAQ